MITRHILKSCVRDETPAGLLEIKAELRLDKRSIIPYLDSQFLVFIVMASDYIGKFHT